MGGTWLAGRGRMNWASEVVRAGLRLWGFEGDETRPEPARVTLREGEGIPPAWAGGTIVRTGQVSSIGRMPASAAAAISSASSAPSALASATRKVSSVRSG